MSLTELSIIIKKTVTNQWALLIFAKYGNMPLSEDKLLHYMDKKMEDNLRRSATWQVSDRTLSNFK
jgi:hypothetical protein